MRPAAFIGIASDYEPFVADAAFVARAARNGITLRRNEFAPDRFDLLDRRGGVAAVAVTGDQLRESALTWAP